MLGVSVEQTIIIFVHFTELSGEVTPNTIP